MMKRLIAVAALGAVGFGLGACTPAQVQHYVHVAGVGAGRPGDCPTDGTTFGYGSCRIPPGVAGPGVPVIAGAEAKIVDPAGCGLQVVPASYTLVGRYVCQPVPH